MKEIVLIIGGGGREHALGWKLAQSPQVRKLYFAPGNGGTQTLGQNIALDLADHDALVRFVRENGVSFVVVAQDDYLADGMGDSLGAASIPYFGPTRDAAKIEWSKAYAKEVMKAANIPTARHKSFTDYEAALPYVSEHPLPVVIKASGLAGGKGVVIAESREEALETLKAFMVDAKHGKSSKEVVIEEFMEGVEFSTHALCDGETALMFPPSEDHKRVFDNDEGPNTGGMGTIAPLPWVSEEDMETVRVGIVEPLMKELSKRGSPFKGLLYPGLMMTKDGPKVVEFNARFGDPETQSYMRLLESDVFELMKASAEGTLKNVELKWSEDSAACIILASSGYPGTYEKGKEITGISAAEEMEDTVVFHAGTKREGERLLTNGGRVLNVTATGPSLQDALKKAYEVVEKISFDGMQYRKDIGRGLAQ